MSYPYYSTKNRFAGHTQKIGFTILKHCEKPEQFKARLDVINSDYKKQSFICSNPKEFIEKAAKATNNPNILADAHYLSTLWHRLNPNPNMNSLHQPFQQSFNF